MTSSGGDSRRPGEREDGHYVIHDLMSLLLADTPWELKLVMRSFEEFGLRFKRGETCDRCQTKQCEY